LFGQTYSVAELDAFRARYGLPPGYVAEVARIEEKKNQLAVIEALYDEPAPLVFVGKPSPYFAPDYADRCYRLGERRGRTYFLGWIPDVDLPLLYAGASAHILPSWSELPGLASLEAGASGTRVISTRVSGLPEMVGEQGWYCDPYDRVSIRDAVSAALSSEVPASLRARLLRQYSWPSVAEATARLYEDVLASKK
jgi:glycosyltransferase involved in cell wall biosynthesis